LVETAGTSWGSTATGRALGVLLVTALCVWCPAAVAEALPADATGSSIADSTDLAVRDDSTPGPNDAVDAEPDTRKLRDRFNSFQFSDVLPDNLDQTAFEASLRDQFYGTYVFYETLPVDRRQIVYDSYRVDPHIASIRATTLDLLR